MRANLSKWSLVFVLALAGASAHAQSAQSFSARSGFLFTGASQSYDHERSFNSILNNLRARGDVHERGGDGRGADGGLRNGDGWAHGYGRNHGNGNGNGGGHVSPIPEPSTYILMLAGLGAVAFVARRRRSG
jgi:hypothetical protein